MKREILVTKKNKMKTTLRIPTSEQFAFIEIETEVSSPEDAIEAYHHATRLLKANNEGLPEKDFNTWLDKYLESNTGEMEPYTKMSKAQQEIIQIIKRSVKRIAYKNNKQ